jgi:hypothetical protein
MGRTSSRVKTSEPSATAADAQIILQLYDLRREPEMRKARYFVSADFWPRSAEDILQIMRAFPSQENAWLGQVTSYWEMAAALVLRGALHEGLFFDCSGEMYCVFAKFKPYLQELRKKTPKILLNVEEVIMRSQPGRERMERLENRLARREQKLSAKKAAISTAATGDI